MRITKVTRRDIFTALEVGVSLFYSSPRYSYSSMLLEEIDFLARLYDLDSLPSTDPRFETARQDIVKHTVSNYDWDGFWLKDDERFLKDCSDEELLIFLAELFHPEVRDESLAWFYLLDSINELLEPDAFELYEINQISGRAVYGWRDLRDRNAVLHTQAERLAAMVDTDYIRNHIEIMLSLMDSAPHIAIGKAKELLEIVYKQVLSDRGISYATDIDFGQLGKKASFAIGLTPENIVGDSPAKNLARIILGNLGHIANGMANLRNLYGDGHGKEAGFVPLPTRYAQLAVGAATAAAYFVWDTHIESKNG